MTTTRADHRLPHSDGPGRAADQRERLRTVAPVLVAVLLLFGLTTVGLAALGELLDFGIWLVGTE